MTLGQAHVGPRAWASWDPFGDRRTKLALGYSRSYGHLSLPHLLVDPSAGLSRLDEFLAVIERELFQDLAIGADGTRRLRTGVPTFDGDRDDRHAWSGSVYLRKIESRRWFADLRYQRTILTDPSTQTLVDDGSLEGFGHVAKGLIGWSLPTDPWTSSISLIGAWMDEPLGTIAPDPTRGQVPNQPRWSASALLSQDIDVRKGKFTLDLEGSYLSPLPDARDLATLVSYQPPLLELEGWEGLRLRAGLRYTF